MFQPAISPPTVPPQVHWLGVVKVLHSHSLVYNINRQQILNKHNIFQFNHQIAISYLIFLMSYLGQTVQQFVPTYVVKSDYLPTRVVDGNAAQTSQLLRQYEQEKRRGRVFTQRPADFNPNRYASFRVYENVKVNQPMDQNQFNTVVRR